MTSIAPTYQNNQIILQKTTDDLIVAAYDSGILFVHGWTVSVPVEDVKTYVRDFSRNAMEDVDGGFFHHDGKFVISHAGAKLTLTAEEGTAIVKFLSEHYGLE